MAANNRIDFLTLALYSGLATLSGLYTDMTITHEWDESLGKFLLVDVLNGARKYDEFENGYNEISGGEIDFTIYIVEATERTNSSTIDALQNEYIESIEAAIDNYNFGSVSFNDRGNELYITSVYLNEFVKVPQFGSVVGLKYDGKLNYNY